MPAASHHLTATYLMYLYNYNYYPLCVTFIQLFMLPSFICIVFNNDLSYSMNTYLPAISLSIKKALYTQRYRK